MRHLKLPDSITIRVITWAGSIAAPRDVPFNGKPLAFHVHAFARHKNDYFLGPFFSDGGRVRISRDDLERSARIHLEFGLMDYHALTECFPMIEIAAWSAEETKRAIKARAAELKTGRFFSHLEREVWGSPKDYVARLKNAANHRLPGPVFSRIRDEWDGSRQAIEYEYRVPQAAAA